MDLIDAVYKRKSIRRYQNKNLTSEQLNEIKELCSSVEQLYNDIGMKVSVIEEGKQIQNIMSGLIGNLGKVIAPHYLVITSELKAGYMENAGYAVEKIVLQLTAMGIATCWLGGHVKEYELKDIVCIPKDQGYIAMIAIGHAMDEGSLYRKDSTEAKRKQISDFVIGSYEPTWQRPLEAVRIAPSAANTQPWRFVIEGKKAHVFCEGPSNFISRKLLGEINMLDVGNALCHIELGAREIGRKVNFLKEQNREIPKLQYIATVELL